MTLHYSAVDVQAWCKTRSKLAMIGLISLCSFVSTPTRTFLNIVLLQAKESVAWVGRKLFIECSGVWICKLRDNIKRRLRVVCLSNCSLHCCELFNSVSEQSWQRTSTTKPFPSSWSLRRSSGNDSTKEIIHRLIWSSANKFLTF